MKSISFALPIWRLLYDHSPTAQTKGLIALELRAKNQVQWCVMDTQSATILWQKMLPNTDWWTSLTSFKTGILELLQYENAEQLMPKKQHHFDALSGEVAGISTISIQHEALMHPWQIAYTYPPTSEYHQILCSFIEESTGQKPVFSINYAEIFGNQLVLLYFYNTNAITLSRSILVINSSRQTLLHRDIPYQAELSGFDAFLVNENCIVCLEDLYKILIINWSTP